MNATQKEILAQLKIAQDALNLAKDLFIKNAAKPEGRFTDKISCDFRKSLLEVDSLHHTITLHGGVK